MTPVLARARADLRARVVETIVLVLLVGLTGSMVIAAVAGARRTSTAPDRLVAEVGRPDALVYDIAQADPDQVAALPQVEDAVAVTFLGVDAVEPRGGLIAFATSDPFVGGQLVEGAPPDPDDPLAAVIDVAAVEELGLGVGDEIVLGTYSPEQFETFDLTEYSGEVTVRVAAVIREPDDLSAYDPSAVDQVGYLGRAGAYLPTSFLDTYGDEVATVNTLVGYRLDGGPARAPEFREAVRGLPGGDTVQFFDQPLVDPSTQRAVDVQAFGLLAFAVALALAAALVLGQSLARQIRVDGADDDVLRAMGMTGAQRIAVAGVRGGVVGLGGAILAAWGAAAWSPLAPVGLARNAEPHPGFALNAAVLGVGATAIVALFVVLSLLTGWSVVRLGRRSPTPAPRSRVAEGAARAGLGPPVVAGLTFITAPRRSTGPTATRSALVGVVAGLAALVAAATVLASLDQLTAAPVRYGWTFDAVAGSPFAGDADVVGASVADAPGVVAVARAGSAGVQVGEDEFGLIGIEAGTGIPVAKVIDGREPLGTGEVALGPRTLDQLDLAIDDTVAVDSGTGPVELTVTGTAVIPEVGDVGTGFGEGGVVTLDTYQQVAPASPPTIALLDLREGMSAPERAELEERSGGLLLRPVLPTAVYDVERIRSLPVVLAAVFGVLAVAALVHSLVSIVRSFRRQLAVLKALGLVRRQILGITMTMALALGGAALALGLPLGVIVGRVVWLALGERLGVITEPTVPVRVLVALVPLGAGVAALASLLPGWLASRVRSADLFLD